jgi:LMBR1-like membrane protein
MVCLQEQVTLGLASLSKLGMFGATLEIVLIIYLVATSAVGLFTSSLMQRVRPTPSATPLSLIILHCAVLLLLSSALPLLSRILGTSK